MRGPPGCQPAGGLLKSSSAPCPALSCFWSLVGLRPSWVLGLGRGLAGVCASRSCSGCGNAAAPGCSSGPRMRRSGPEVGRDHSPLTAGPPCCPGPEHPGNQSLSLPVWGEGRAQPGGFFSPMNCPIMQPDTPSTPSRELQDHPKQGEYQRSLSLGDGGHMRPAFC